MNKQKIFENFINGVSLEDISRTHAIERMKVRDCLVELLGRRRYLEIARSNGGKAVAKKLTIPGYRLKYSRKMSQSVKESLGIRMQEEVFRAAWCTKAKRGSEIGIGKLRESMMDLKFHEEWVKKCRAAGKTAYVKRVGIHKASPSARREWSILGLKKTGKKTAGPHGEKMYNKLEVSVARILDSLGFEYIYEKILVVRNKNGFVSIDFVLPHIQNLFIEVTYWSDSKEKTRELARKWSLIKNQYPNAELIVVTKPERLQEYRTLLQIGINVFTPIMLKRHLTDAKLAG